MGLGQEGDREGEVVSWEQEIALRGTCIATRSHADSPASQLATSPSLSLSWPRLISIKSELSQTVLILGDEAHSDSYSTALTASHAPVSPTDTAGTHSHFTHSQAQPHQSTALLRVGKVHHFVTQVASGSSLHSAPLQRSRLSPRQHADGLSLIHI